jgi:hypothetical protein
VGRVYNETNPVPYKLPDHMTRSTWKTDSSPKSTGFSELMFEDKDKQELVYLQAQKDMQKLVKNYETERTFRNRLSVVGEQRQAVVGLLDATMVGDSYLLELIEPPSKEALAIEQQKDPKIKAKDTKIEVRDERIIFTTGKATVAFDRRNIRFDADGDITIRSEKKDVILEGKMMFINTMPAPSAPKPGAPKPPKQGSEDLDQLYDDAKKAQVELSGATKAIGRDTSGETLIPPNLKRRKRAREKIRNDYGGDASQLTDIARTSLVYDKLESVYDALEKVESQFEVVRIKDRFERPAPGGYRDILLNLKTSDGHVVEMQLHIADILHEKDKGEGHDLYEQMRDIEGAAKKDDRPLTPGETKKMAKITKRSEKVYGDAFAKAQK